VLLQALKAYEEKKAAAATTATGTAASKKRKKAGGGGGGGGGGTTSSFTIRFTNYAQSSRCRSVGDSSVSYAAAIVRET